MSTIKDNELMYVIYGATKEEKNMFFLRRSVLVDLITTATAFWGVADT